MTKRRRSATQARAKMEVPPGFIKRLEQAGFLFMRMGMYYASEEMLTTSELWERTLRHFVELKNVPVTVAVTFVDAEGVEDDPAYDAPRGPDGHDYLYELMQLMLKHAPTPGGKLPIYLADSGTQLPNLVRDLIDPPSSCPLARAAPDGVYLVSLDLTFENMAMHLRINRKARKS